MTASSRLRTETPLRRCYVRACPVRFTDGRDAACREHPDAQPEVRGRPLVLEHYDDQLVEPVRVETIR